MTTQNPTTNTLAFHGSPVKVINHNGLAVTSRKIARTFYKQMKVAFVSTLHSIQGHLAS